MKRDLHQRKAYALRRLSLAVDRQICARTQADKERAAQWAKAWAVAAGLNPHP